jgi:hypothetical protein
MNDSSKFSLRPTQQSPCAVPMESVAAIDPDDASVTCRFCLGTENDEFVAPCECRGGQRWVHLMCRWRTSQGDFSRECMGMHCIYIR